MATVEPTDGFSVDVALIPIDESMERRFLTITTANPALIGRASKSTQKTFQSTPNNALFDCAVMSRNHAKLEANPWATSCDQVTLMDDGSMHGTYVNGHRIMKGRRMALRQGDILRFGDNVARGESLHKPMLVKYERLPNTFSGDKSSSPMPAMDSVRSAGKSPGFHVSVPSDVDSSDDDQSIHDDDDQSVHDDDSCIAVSVLDLSHRSRQALERNSEKLEDVHELPVTQLSRRSASSDVEYVRSSVAKTTVVIPDTDIVDSNNDKPAEVPAISSGIKYAYVESDDDSEIDATSTAAVVNGERGDAVPTIPADLALAYAPSKPCDTFEQDDVDLEHLSELGGSIEGEDAAADKDEGLEGLSSKRGLPQFKSPYLPSWPSRSHYPQIVDLTNSHFGDYPGSQSASSTNFNATRSAGYPQPTGWRSHHNHGQNRKPLRSRWDEGPSSWTTPSAPPLGLEERVSNLTVPPMINYGAMQFPDIYRDYATHLSTGPTFDHQSYNLGLYPSPPSCNISKFDPITSEQLWPQQSTKEKISINNLVEASSSSPSKPGPSTLQTGTKRKADTLYDEIDRATWSAATPVANTTKSTVSDTAAPIAESAEPVVASASTPVAADTIAVAEPAIETLSTPQTTITTQERPAKRTKKEQNSSTSLGSKARYFAAGGLAMHLVFHFNLVNLALDRLGWPRYE